LLYIRQYIIFSKKAGIKNKVNCEAREGDLGHKQKAVEDFLLDKHKRKQSPQTVNLALNAVKFLYTEVLKDPQKIKRKWLHKMNTRIYYSCYRL
ncbi:MAG: phage integrase N-terminal SAM-like domain-containing protein, partial [Candidatus Pacebacteria bacterium]|nr:phage integrase N-terminal SAM-like domain-containing protein [Candidatus Paceibacterota bacterium]